MILFLDFDGVTHRTPVGTDIDLYFERVGLLAAWMREHPEVQIVVSSSWREQYSVEELRDLLFHDQPDLQGRVVGTNPDLGRLYSEYVRSGECQLWLNDNDHPFSAWVAVDDEPVRFCPLLHDEHLVVCSPAVGLTSGSLDQAWRNLERQRLAEPTRRARGERNGAPLSASQLSFLRALSNEHITSMSKSKTEPEIKGLTDAEEAEIVASIAQARRLVDGGAKAASDRRAKWMALPEGERWVTVCLDLDEVMCVGQPYAAGALHEALQRGEELDQKLLDKLFSPVARGVLLHVQAQLTQPIRYVISSSWREHFSRDQLELIFRSSGLAFVADNLHDGRAWRCYLSSFTPDRARDIESWIHFFHHGEPYVVIDDTSSGGGLNYHGHFPDGEFYGRVILCKPGVGLTAGHVDQIVAALRRSV